MDRKPSSSRFVGIMNPLWLGVDVNPEGGVALGKYVSLVRTPQWLFDERWFPDHMTDREKTLVQTARVVLLVDALRCPPKPHPQERIALAELSLWLLKNSNAIVHMNIHIEEYQRGDAAIDATQIKHTLIPSSRGTSGRFSVDELAVAGRMNDALGELSPGSVLTAADMLYYALREPRKVIRYLLLWVALEALFAPPSGGDATHKLSERMAVFLGTGADPESVWEIFKDVKKAYALRSKVSHGREGDLKEIDEYMAKAEGWIRGAMCSILQSEERRALFGNDRDTQLDRLCLRCP